MGEWGPPLESVASGVSPTSFVRPPGIWSEIAVADAITTSIYRVDSYESGAIVDRLDASFVGWTALGYPIVLGEDDGSLTAYDLQGEVVWQVDPGVVDADFPVEMKSRLVDEGEVVLFTNRAGELVEVDASTGAGRVVAAAQASINLVDEITGRLALRYEDRQVLVSERS